MANEIQNGFNAVFADGPALNPSQPAKSEIRALGALIQASVDAAIDAAEGASEGLLIGTSWAALHAITGAANQPGRVPTTDTGTHTGYYLNSSSAVVSGTVNNSGEFVYNTSVSDWVRTGDVVEPKTLQKLGLRAVSFDKQILVDGDGILGTARTVYLPRTFTSKDADNALTLTGFGADSTNLPGSGYTQVTWSSNSETYVVYIDTADVASGYKVVAVGSMATTATNTLVPVLTLRNKRVFDCPHAVEVVRGNTGQPLFQYPIALQQNGTGDRLAILPGMVWENDSLSVDTRPASGPVYTKRVVFPGTNSVRWLVYDHAAALRGEDPWIVSGYEPRATPNSQQFPVMIAYNRTFIPLNGVPVVGDRINGTLLQNQMAIGKNDIEKANVFGSSSVPVDITNADLNALGFTRGVGGAGSGAPYYGCLLANPQPLQWAFCRFYVQTDIDNDFGTPKAYFRSTVTPSYNYEFTTVVMSRQLGARAAEFIGWGLLSYPASQPDNPFTQVLAGVSRPDGRDVRVCGLQVGYGAAGQAWVSDEDYPDYKTSASEANRRLNDIMRPVEEAGLIYPKKIFTIAGRPMPVYPSQMIAASTEGLTHRVSLVATDAVTGLVEELTDPYIFKLDGQKYAGAARIYARASGSKDARLIQDVTIQAAPANTLSGKSPSVLMIGDSLSATAGSVARSKAKFTTLGATPAFIGTIDCVSWDYNSTPYGSSALGEGRSSREYKDYINATGTALAPVTNWSSYMALTSEQRKDYNPFIRASAGGDNADYIRNGQIFDMDFYLTRSGFADPKYVIINLGTNDTAQENITAGLEILYNQTRAALPNAHVAFVGNANAMTAGGMDRWNTRGSSLLLTTSQFVLEQEDDKLYFLPVHAHLSREVGWRYAETGTDAATGAITATFDDILHFAREGAEQFSEVVAAWVACIEA